MPVLSAVILICFSLPRPGVVSEQKSSHFEMQRGQKSPVAAGQPGPRCPAAARQESADRSAASGPTASLPNPGERGDGGGLLLQAPSLLRRRGPVWLYVWACAGKTAGGPLQSKHEGVVVPASASCPCVVPVSTGDEKLHFQPDEVHVSRISGATLHVLLHIPLFYSRYSRFWVLGCCHGKQPTSTTPTPTTTTDTGGFLERNQSGNESRSGTSVAGSTRPAAGAVPAGDSWGAG